MLTTPKFPEDFRVLYADGGASYWHWHPETPDGYDGTWPADAEPPAWSGGIMIGTIDSCQASLDVGEMIYVSWEYGLDTQSGPSAECSPVESSVQAMVDCVIEEVNRQAAFA